jgi:dUTPase
LGKVIAKTDIQIELPQGCYGRIAPRSGLAANHHIDIGGINNKQAQTVKIITKF